MGEVISAKDIRIACPLNADEVCPTRFKIVSSYTTTAEQKLAAGIMDYYNPNHPRFDHRKMQERLADHTRQVIGHGCIGPNVDVCPVKEAMKKSDKNRGVVGALRVAIKSIKGKE